MLPALQARDPFDPGVPLIEPLVRMHRYGNPLDAYSLFAYTLVPFGLLAAIVLLWVR